MIGGEAFALCSVDGLALEARVHHPSETASHTRADVGGAVVLVHGITADLEEGGMYRRLADQLADAGFGVVRFSFRGHGASAGTPRGVTIAGEMLDVEAAIGRALAEFGGPLVVLASSFGAVPVLESSAYTRPDRLVLWNPILDLQRTFVEPELPWGRANFNPGAWVLANREGALLVDGVFELGRALLAEFSRYNPGAVFRASDVPALIVHGDRDSYVSYNIARAAAQDRGCGFHTVVGSDHGFDSREREDEAIAVTLDWIIGSHQANSAEVSGR